MQPRRVSHNSCSACANILQPEIPIPLPRKRTDGRTRSRQIATSRYAHPPLYDITAAATTIAPPYPNTSDPASIEKLARAGPTPGTPSASQRSTHLAPECYGACVLLARRTTSDNFARPYLAYPVFYLTSNATLDVEFTVASGTAIFRQDGNSYWSSEACSARALRVCVRPRSVCANIVLTDSCCYLGPARPILSIFLSNRL